MIKTKFKVLMHYGTYVDANMLVKGIYECTKPFIYHNDETIESMIETAEKLKDLVGSQYIVNEKYFENLKQCQLVDVELLIK